MKVPHRFCHNCFATEGIDAKCAHCGYQQADHHSPIILSPGTMLHNQYLVGRVLGEPGGFGITYLAWDTYLQARMAVKEYLPRELAGRNRDQTSVLPHTSRDAETFRYGLEQFLQEARILAKFDHPNVVRVRTFFEAHGTAYLVMDYYEGTTLAAYLSRNGGITLPERQAIDILMPVLDGLRMVHARNILHRDIDPNNIYLAKTEGGGVRPLLLDFGAARVAMGERSKSLSVILKQGYAPYEQYRSRGNQGPWTDIYACSATLYRMVTGKVPLESVERVLDDTLVSPKHLASSLSESMESAIMQGLAVRPEDRPQTVEAFQRLLMPAAASVPPPVAKDPVVSKPPVPVPPLPSPMPSPDLASPTPHYTKVGGWLLFFCISLTVLNPLLTLANIGEIGEAVDYYGEDSEEGVFLILDMLVAFGFIVYSFLTGLNLWRIKPGAVRKAQTYLKVFFGYSVLEWILTIGMLDYVGSEIVQSGIYFGLWYSYLAKSKRVSETFGDAR